MSASFLYVGDVRHRRFEPARHVFTYRVYMIYLDLEETTQALRGRWFWSAERPALARFRRTDHFGDPRRPLADVVRDLVEQETGKRPTGAIRLLTNLRHFGYVFNPVSFYYCHDPDGTLEALVAEVSNTPWNERHLYVLPTNGRRAGVYRFRNSKEFHVSPFLPMDLVYDWTVTAPGSRLAVQIAASRDASRILDATLLLRRQEITGANLARALARHPLMTVKVIAAIHLEAFRLWRKGVPWHPHPGRTP